MGPGVALAAWLWLGASPTVSAPIRFSTPPLAPAAVTWPASAAWDGTSFQVGMLVGNSWLLNRLSPSGTLLDSTGVIIFTPRPNPVTVGCAMGQCLATDDSYSYLVAQGEPSSVTLADGGFLDLRGIGWDGTYFVVLSADVVGGALRIGRFTANGAALDGPGTALPHPILDISNADLSCMSGQCLAVWHDMNELVPIDAVHAARFSASGTLLDTTALTVSLSAAIHERPGVANDGTNYLVAWSEAAGDGGLAMSALVASRPRGPLSTSPGSRSG
jgi:hypothetical protein